MAQQGLWRTTGQAAEKPLRGLVALPDVFGRRISPKPCSEAFVEFVFDFDVSCLDFWLWQVLASQSLAAADELKK